MKTVVIAAALTVALATTLTVAQARAAVIVVTSAENSICQTGNVNVAWFVVFYKANSSKRSDRRYISSLDNKCMVLPVTAPNGTQIVAAGMLGDRLATNGLSPSVTEGCFNVEAYSVGLASDGDPRQFNPQDPNNIINDQGYGLFWDETDADSQQTFEFTVVGCGGPGKCQMPKTVYNTDIGLTDSSGCTVLAPLS
jgi:hypothetical protein